MQTPIESKESNQGQKHCFSFWSRENSSGQRDIETGTSIQESRRCGADMTYAGIAGIAGVLSLVPIVMVCVATKTAYPLLLILLVVCCLLPDGIARACHYAAQQNSGEATEFLVPSAN